MNVTKTNHDEVSALLTVTLDKADYKENVDKQLINYAKKAQVPGFRKGKVPLGMVRRQYEAAAAYDEINKQVSEGLNRYISENKIRLVGQPVPVPVDNLDYNAEQISVDFEIGFEPDFSIDLSKYEAPHYNVEAGEKEIGQSVENMQKRFAEKIPLEKINAATNVELEIEQIVEEDAVGEHHHHPKFAIVTQENKKAFDLVKDLQIGDSVNITKEDLTKDEDLLKDLGYVKEEAEHIHHDLLKITVKEVYELKLAELNQDLFDKVYGKDVIKSEQELKDRVKNELDEYFQQNADTYFVNKILEQINDKELIKLPDDFLVKWLKFSNQNIKDEKQAWQIYVNEKPQIKMQIIENKLLDENGIKIDYSEVVNRAEEALRNQFAIYGIHDTPEDDLKKYAVEMLQNQEQLRQITSDIAMNKLKTIVLEKSKKTDTQISHDEFLEKLKK